MAETHKDLPGKIKEMENKYDQQFQVVFKAIRALMSPREKPKKQIGFEVKEPRARYEKKKAAGTSVNTASQLSHQRLK